MDGRTDRQTDGRTEFLQLIYALSAVPAGTAVARNKTPTALTQTTIISLTRTKPTGPALHMHNGRNVRWLLNIASLCLRAYPSRPVYAIIVTVPTDLCGRNRMTNLAGSIVAA